MSKEQRQSKGRGLVDRKLVEAPSKVIADRPKAALLLWFFRDIRCGVFLFIVISVITPPLFRFSAVDTLSSTPSNALACHIGDWGEEEGVGGGER